MSTLSLRGVHFETSQEGSPETVLPPKSVNTTCILSRRNNVELVRDRLVGQLEVARAMIKRDEVMKRRLV
jgi:hypothetical protein